MKSKSKITKAEQARLDGENARLLRDACITWLRGRFVPGSAADTIVRHISRSEDNPRGMSISVIGPGCLDYTRKVAWALGGRIDRWHGGIVMVRGEGLDNIPAWLDMESAFVYNLSRTLYPDGFVCPGERRGYFDGGQGAHAVEWLEHPLNGCPSWDHVDKFGETGYLEGRLHSDGGHALWQHGLDLHSPPGSYFRIRAREHLRLLSGRWGIDSWSDSTVK